MTTLLRRHPEQNLQKSRSTRYSQYFRDVGPSYILTKPTSGLCGLDLGISEAFGENSKLGDTPNNISTLQRAHTTHHFKSKPSYAEVWALRVLASATSPAVTIKEREPLQLGLKPCIFSSCGN